MISTQYQAYKQPLFDILSQFQSLWYGHYGRITIAKNRIEFLKPDTGPVHSTPYPTGPKTREFDKAKIDKMLAENYLEDARMKLAAPTVFVVFVPKKDGTVQFFFDYCKLNAVAKRGSFPNTSNGQVNRLPGESSSLFDARC